MKKKRHVSKFGFIVSTLGAAIGLGNVWGFPTLLKANGGLAFFVLYILAIVTCAIPLLILEFNIGNMRRKSLINIFDEENPTASRFIGWFQSAFMFVVANYYTVLIGYVLISLLLNFTNLINSPLWFNNNILNAGGVGVTGTANFQWMAYLAFIVIVIAAGVIIMFRAKGIEKANVIFIPVLFVILLVLAIYVLTIPGALAGLGTVLMPTEKTLASFGNVQVWSDAFGLGVFTVCVGSGFMLLFAGAASKKQDNANKAYILSFGVLAISLLTLILVFGSAGVLVHETNPGLTSIDDYVKAIDQAFPNNDGASFIFNVFPQTFSVINHHTIAGFGNFLGVLFFTALLFAGLSSIIAMLEVVVNGIFSNYKVNEKKVIFILMLLMAIIGLVLMFKDTNQLIYSFQALAGSVNMLLMALTELILFIHIYKKLKLVIAYNNEHSWIKIGKTYQFTVSYVTAALLTVNIIFMFYAFISSSLSKPWWLSVLAVLLGIIIPLLVSVLSVTVLRKYQTKAILNYGHEGEK
ncbi:sodium-dependent transporter [Spiroplasma sp. NBRC 100390]|uniref:sodium-dependent transporter n=1 Tax=unclassified Spiroplasma TaxID=2637901 RepID=UPI0008929FA9|nr:MULTISPECIES: sodium-dependent transporter [unclassified Spiroplasma]AOX43706.1 sodium-dependent transporter [Spiroplasma sp. TU-14]APE13176.1 sodium-dependent transporter [Spiroplasma sp. NBRC 100390]